MKKTISVCIATFNGAPYIGEQLRSVLPQLDNDSEVIISDDHSTDGTIEVILSLDDPRVKIIMNDRLASPVYNAENALKHAKGDLIFLADQDDVWAPEKVSVMTGLLDKYDLVVSDAIVTDGSGNILHDSFFKLNWSGRGFLRNWVNNSFMGCCMAFNRKVLDYVLPFPGKLAMHDSWIGLNAALSGKYFFVRQPLVYYRRHGNNTITSFKKTHLPVSYQVSYRLVMMYHIIRRRLRKKSDNHHKEESRNHFTKL
jgi:glycosyltransferase involved in cell wall biosynthesis